jgi:hypothetical protein
MGFGAGELSRSSGKTKSFVSQCEVASANERFNGLLGTVALLAIGSEYRRHLADRRSIIEHLPGLRKLATQLGHCRLLDACP